jgi:hypothetical protein
MLRPAVEGEQLPSLRVIFNWFDELNRLGKAR